MNKHVVITDKPARINVANHVQKLRRMRTELSFLLQQIDDALDRIEQEKKS